uniref:Uncharacterized protein n=1 Tax=Sicyonia whispovirus TaxID=2984283 RepID=A0A9C7BR90_9VIRU|nr:MAG: hypothetical protein [Sicyonia whispovirus]
MSSPQFTVATAGAAAAPSTEPFPQPHSQPVTREILEEESSLSPGSSGDDVCGVDVCGDAYVAPGRRRPDQLLLSPTPVVDCTPATPTCDSMLNPLGACLPVAPPSLDNIVSAAADSHASCPLVTAPPPRGVRSVRHYRANPHPERELNHPIEPDVVFATGQGPSAEDQINSCLHALEETHHKLEELGESFKSFTGAFQLFAHSTKNSR